MTGRGRATLAIAAACTLLAAFTAAQTAGPPTFDLSWRTVDGGGGTSIGGAFAVSGTIGQPDAGPALTGGSYALSGGFWFGGGPAPTCPADLANDDGLVDVFDLFVLLNNWGTGGPGASLAAPNSTVDVFDLFALLGAWGACN